jgi:integrase/recombinase XerD
MQITKFAYHNIQTMEQNYFISLFLDTRRELKNGKYPVKLRVYTSYPEKRQKLYSTIFELNEKEFQSSWGTVKPRTEYKQLKRELQAIETKAIDTAKELKPFSFEQFEKKLFRKAGEGENVFYQYELTIKTLKENKQIGTASNYELSMKSLKEFASYMKGKEVNRLMFSEITINWLNKYERFMTEPPKVKNKDELKVRSLTTVSMYLRALRTIFNKAIADKEIDSELYPFGKRKYQVPSVRSVKKALSKEQLKQLFEAPAKTLEQQKAKDFWFFSYSCNGMNIKDIVLLRFKDLQDDKLIFYRAKTINTSKSDLKPVTVYLTDYAKEVIEKYGNKDTSSQNLIFPIINESFGAIEKQKAIKNFTKFINQNLKKLALNNGITSEISTYWARHSFATNAIRSGASMEFVSEALSHSNLKITQGYFSGFEDKDKKELMENLMKF